MKHIIIILFLTIFFANSSFCQSKHQVSTTVNELLKKYPKIHLIDIYKSCYQDFMGSEHLITDKEAAKKYIVRELNEMSTDRNAPSFEKCGLNGDYIRVDLDAVAKGMIDVDSLANWFVESSNVKKHSFKAWKKRWNKIEKHILEMSIALPDFDRESKFIQEMFGKGGYACTHSREYKENYSPHYRIISRKILIKNGLVPLLGKNI